MPLSFEAMHLAVSNRVILRACPGIRKRAVIARARDRGELSWVHRLAQVYESDAELLGL